MVNYYRARAPFPGSPSGVRHARQWLRQRMAGHPRADDIDLCAAEIATNAVHHTASAGWLFAVSVEEEPAGARVTVEDFGTADSKPEPIPPTAIADEGDSGWGLLLVTALADAWGYDGDASGRDTWAWWDRGELHAFGRHNFEQAQSVLPNVGWSGDERGTWRVS